MNNYKETALEKLKPLSQAANLAAGIIYLILGFIVSVAEFPLSAHPLGVALTVCCEKTNGRLKKYTDFSFYMLCTGIVLASLTYKKDGILYFTMYCALFFIRYALTGGKFNETRVIKMALALISSLCIGFVGGAINGFGLWETMGILILSICSPIFAYLFDGIWDGEDNQVLLEAGYGSFLFALLYGIKSIHVFSFSLPMMLSVVITLCAARKKGALYGALTGLVCGIAGENFILPSVLGIVGFCAGIFFEYSDIFAILCAYISGIAYGIYCTGFDAVGYLAPEFLVGCATFFPLKGLITPAPALPAVSENGEIEDDIDRSDRLAKFSEAFSALSDIALDAEKSDDPDKAECEYFVKRAFENECGECMMKEVCHLNDEIMNESLRTRMCGLLYEKRLDVSQLPETFSAKCRRSGRIISRCLESYADASKEAVPAGSRILSGEYNTVSKLLKSTAERSEKNAALPEAFKIKRALDNLKIAHKSFDIKGIRHAVIDVKGVSSANIQVTSARIQLEIQKECGFCISAPEFFVRDSVEIMRMTRCPAISLEYAKSTRTKSGEQKNGDFVTVFENGDDCFYSLICDGMGSGRDAAKASRIAASFVEKLITSASPEDITIEMLNNFLISKDNECFSTIDLLEIDKLESKASFIKAGAAPAFIIRNGKLHKISSNTPPVGVLYSMTAEKTTVHLEKNDVIVMMSDGIISNGELAPWLMELFTYELDGTPNVMADKIISRAVKECGRGDDMSVAVMRIA